MSNDDTFRVFELSLQGFNCSQILMIVALEAQGKNSPEVVRAMSGLVSGCGTGKLCGALTGGCCVLGMYAGVNSNEHTLEGNEGISNELRHMQCAKDALRFPQMRSQLVEWFENKYKAQYGGIDCSEIIQDDAKLKMARCPQIVTETLLKIKEILAENGYDWTQCPTTSASLT